MHQEQEQLIERKKEEEEEISEKVSDEEGVIKYLSTPTSILKNYTPKLKIMTEESPIMFDPSVFTSDEHLRKLFWWSSLSICIPKTFNDLLLKLEKQEITEREVNNVLKHFIFPSARRWVKLSKYWREIKPRIKPYEAKAEYKEYIFKGIQEQLPKLPETISHILIEEYSFMREHSSLLLKGNQTIRYFTKFLPLTIDATNALKDKKEKIFSRIRGPRWVVALLLEANAVRSATSDPLWSNIFAGAGFVLVFFDP